MALRFGYRTNDKRETIWREDEALGDVPPSALDDWQKDGEAHHLRPFVKPGATPTVFKMRALTFSEAQYVSGFQDGSVSGMMITFSMCFRLGVSFPSSGPGSAADSYTSPTTGQSGMRKSDTESKNGFRMLSEGFCDQLRVTYPEMVFFYGSLIFKATFPTDSEKKASSPPSTQTPSSEVASTKDDTAAPLSTDAGAA